ncbi:hypothetical protein DFH27DRAFT_613711 [Peziza echinospora]|nr:hypothetical protein DFH27DRAFT_613711 [Peziza echinospora]
MSAGRGVLADFRIRELAILVTAFFFNSNIRSSNSTKASTSASSSTATITAAAATTSPRKSSLGVSRRGSRAARDDEEVSSVSSLSTLDESPRSTLHLMELGEEGQRWSQILASGVQHDGHVLQGGGVQKGERVQQKGIGGNWQQTATDEDGIQRANPRVVESGSRYLVPAFGHGGGYVSINKEESMFTQTVALIVVVETLLRISKRDLGLADSNGRDEDSIGFTNVGQLTINIDQTEPFVRLSKPEGATGASALFNTFNIFTSPYKALLQRNWIVFFSTPRYILAMLVVPPLQGIISSIVYVNRGEDVTFSRFPAFGEDNKLLFPYED